jgi:hypothetical protein
MESGQSCPLNSPRARSEKTGFTGSARSPSQTALHRSLPGDRFCGTAVGADFWFLAHFVSRLCAGRRRAVFLQAGVEGVRLLGCSPAGAEFATRSRSPCEPVWPATRSPRDPIRFEIIFPVTFQSPYEFRHTRYASVSISGGPVSECDRAGRRSVNIGLPPSMNGCEKPFIHGLNRRFTVLNS